jgi:predicted DNA-binding transcriptional regulator AlpA
MDSQPPKNPFELLLDQFRVIVREEIKAAANGKRDDRLLDIDEAAKLLSVSPDYLYHNRKRLPFARKLGPKILRFSYVGMLRWIESKKLA